MRFELIDRVLERSEDQLTAVKSVTRAEEYLQDHFPGFPVLPGVMMLEALVQAGRRLIDEKGEGVDSPLVIREVRNVRYGRFVQPGQTLTLRVSLRKRDEAGYEFQGTGTVQEQMAVHGRFRLMPIEDGLRR